MSKCDLEIISRSLKYLPSCVFSRCGWVKWFPRDPHEIHCGVKGLRKTTFDLNFRRFSVKKYFAMDLPRSSPDIIEVNTSSTPLAGRQGPHEATLTAEVLPQECGILLTILSPHTVKLLWPFQTVQDLNVCKRDNCYHMKETLLRTLDFQPQHMVKVRPTRILIFVKEETIIYERNKYLEYFLRICQQVYHLHSDQFFNMIFYYPMNFLSQKTIAKLRGGIDFKTRLRWGWEVTISGGLM